jgi:hypothetical protein
VYKPELVYYLNTTELAGRQIWLLVGLHKLVATSNLRIPHKPRHLLSHVVKVTEAEVEEGAEFVAAGRGRG